MVFNPEHDDLNAICPDCKMEFVDCPDWLDAHESTEVSEVEVGHLDPKTVRDLTSAPILTRS